MAAHTRRILLASASTIAICYTILRMLRALKKPRKLLRGPEEIGTVVGESELQDASAPEYDIVIIGGGTAGCVLASRLSADPQVRVLLLEAGGSGTANILSTVPASYSQLFRTAFDYNLHTVEQPNAGGRQCYWPRGKMLGGCSSINAMMFHYGAPSDYDEWAKSNQEGSSEWSYQKFQRYFLLFEKFVPSKLFPMVDSSLRGSSGPVEVGYFGYFSNFCSQFLVACDKVGIPSVPDVNTATCSLGATKVMTYIDSKGRRVSTESAYLTSDVLNRPNLTIATHATVTKILFETKGGEKRAAGVEFSRKKGGPRFVVKARKEVVLSAGAVHSPQILMLSGVGPSAHLTARGIPVVHDLPGVGQHLMDHPAVYLRFRVKEGESLQPFVSRTLVGKLRSLIELLKWKFTGKGPLTSNIAESAAFLRTSDRKVFPSTEYPGEIEDTSSGENAPDLELIACPFAWDNHGLGRVPAGHLGSLGAVLLRPTSLGSITLRSADPFDKPVIDPNYLTAKHDLDVLIRGVKLCLKIARTEPLYSLFDHTTSDTFFDHILHDKDDAHIEKVVRERLETLYHPTSTARMAPLEDGGVVDHYLRVYGIKGLRVVDASIFPTIIAGHTAAPSIAVAEKASAIITDQHKA